MIKNPFRVRDASNPHYLEVLSAIVKLFREESKAAGLDGDVLIVEDFGTTLVQSDWTDRTGWYVTYRLHPLYSRLKPLVEAAARAEMRFNALFPGKPARREEAEPGNPNGKVTLFVENGCHSIGD